MHSAEHHDKMGILLDLDGTIVNSMVPLKEAFISISSKLGVKIDDEQRSRIGKDLRIIIGGRTSRFAELKFLWRIGRIMNLPRWRRLILVFASYSKLKQIARSSPPVKGATEAIKKLQQNQNIKLGLVTSRSRKDAIEKLRNLDILYCFDAIVTRDETKSFKPSAEQVRLAANILNLSTEQCVLVGDMPTDIEAAKQANTLSVAVDTGIFNDEVKSHNPELIINSVAELPDWVDEISKRMRKQNTG
ncbi:MAG: HAD family hydrolase [Candidatus Bathyarchaeia archaeon]|jgi:HAD superfamily hydrolase (TIGR01549 family)